jgi:hypothetical protein
MRFARVILLGLLLLLPAAVANAQPIDVPPTWSGDLWSRPRLTGSWFGLRDELGKKGVIFDVDLLLTPQSVMTGGRDTGSEFWGNADYTLNVDTGKLGLWPGGFLKVSADSGFGHNVLGESGAIVPVNTAAIIPFPGDQTTALTNATFMQFLSSSISASITTTWSRCTTTPRSRHGSARRSICRSSIRRSRRRSTRPGPASRTSTPRSSAASASTCVSELSAWRSRPREATRMIARDERQSRTIPARRQEERQMGTSDQRGIGKLRVLLVLLVLAALVAGYFWSALRWSYSSGERAGWVQKLSKKGWFCKTWEGEMAMVSMPGSMTEKFLFTVWDEGTVEQINKLMGRRVNLHYEQRVGLPTTCFGETRYYVTQVTLVEEIPLAPGVVVPTPAPPAPPATPPK